MLFGMAFFKYSARKVGWLRCVCVCVFFLPSYLYIWIVCYLIRFSREFITRDFKRIQIWTTTTTTTTTTMWWREEKNCHHIDYAVRKKYICVFIKRDRERKKEHEICAYILLLFRWGKEAHFPCRLRKKVYTYPQNLCYIKAMNAW